MKAHSVWCKLFCNHEQLVKSCFVEKGIPVRYRQWGYHVYATHVSLDERTERGYSCPGNIDEDVTDNQVSLSWHKVCKHSSCTIADHWAPVIWLGWIVNYERAFKYLWLLNSRRKVLNEDFRLLKFLFYIYMLQSTCNSRKSSHNVGGKPKRFRRTLIWCLPGKSLVVHRLLLFCMPLMLPWHCFCWRLTLIHLSGLRNLQQIR